MKRRVKPHLVGLGSPLLGGEIALHTCWREAGSAVPCSARLTQKDLDEHPEQEDRRERARGEKHTCEVRLPPHLEAYA